MITEQDLNEAIAECQGVRNPDAKTCMMLASFYTIRNELFPKDGTEIVQYSYDAPPEQTENTIQYNSGTEFGESINGKNIDDILAVIDEAMEAVQVFNPRLYKSIIRKIED